MPTIAGNRPWAGEDPLSGTGGQTRLHNLQQLIHRIRVDDEPFRTATHGLEMRNVDGVRIGTAASWFLEQLNAQDDG